MEAEKSYRNLIWQDADRASGATCFYGTRIPVEYLFDYLERGQTIEEFSADYRIDVAVIRQVIQLAANGLSHLLEAA